MAEVSWYVSSKTPWNTRRLHETSSDIMRHHKRACDTIKHNKILHKAPRDIQHEKPWATTISSIMRQHIYWSLLKLGIGWNDGGTLCPIQPAQMWNSQLVPSCVSQNSLLPSAIHEHAACHGKSPCMMLNSSTEYTQQLSTYFGVLYEKPSSMLTDSRGPSYGLY